MGAAAADDIPAIFFSAACQVTPMRFFIVLLLFVGMAMVIHSIYEEKLQRAQQQTKIEYRFLPRTLYEEQLSEDNRPTSRLTGVF